MQRNPRKKQYRIAGLQVIMSKISKLLKSSNRYFQIFFFNNMYFNESLILLISCFLFLNVINVKTFINQINSIKLSLAHLRNLCGSNR